MSQVSGGWEVAVRTHIASLSPAQRKGFEAPATPEDCINAIEKCKRRPRVIRVLETFRPVLQPLKRFESVIDVLVQTNGGIGSPIWGPLKFAVMVAIDHVETLEKLALILKRIVASLERYTNYEILFKNHMDTQKAISLLYVDLLDLCIRVVRFHSRSSIKMIFSSFDQDFHQVCDNIRHHSTEIDWAANAANIEEAKSARAAEEAARQATTRSNIQKWLSPSTVQDDYFRHYNDCMTGTCDWAFDTEQWQAFTNSQMFKVLRIGGAPGSGKSTLTATAVKHIQATYTTDVLYFFCKGTDESKRHAFQVLRTLLSQLFNQDDILYSWFNGIYHEDGQKEPVSLSDLTQWLNTALEKTSKSLIYIVVDALDECSEAKELLSSLVALSSLPTKKRIKLLISSREDPELLGSIDQTIPELIIWPNHLRALVWNYVGARVAKCKYICNTPLERRVRSEVADAANGLWLYARLMMDEIQRLSSARAVERQMQNLPRGLSQLYRQIFSTKEATLDESEIKLAQHVFLWIDMSTFVTVGGGHLSKRILDIVMQAANGGEEVFDSLELARQLCSPLIEICMNKKGDLSIDFVHHTAAQFVRECSKNNSLEAPIILQPNYLKRLYHAATSVWYFTESPRAKSALNLLCTTHNLMAAQDYFAMAYGLWDAFFLDDLPSHLSNEQTQEASRLCELISEFLQSDHCLLWIEMAVIGNYKGQWTLLLENSLKAREASRKGAACNIPVFKSYLSIREQFFADYSYVLYLTGPRPFDDEFLEICKKPDGFEDRPMALKLLAIGERWKSLVMSYMR